MTSAAGVGMSGAVGVSSAVSSRFDVTGGFRYLASPADFRFTIVPERSIDVGALSADIGVTFRF